MNVNALLDVLILKDEYIDLLNKEIESLIGIADVHGWRSTNVEKGKELRAKIAAKLAEVHASIG